MKLSQLNYKTTSKVGVDFAQPLPLSHPYKNTPTSASRR